MTYKMENPARAARGVPEVSLAGSKIDPELNLETLRQQYLAEIFALTPNTATTIAELAFGEGGAR